MPGDVSSAAFFLAAAALVPGSDLMLRNVGLNATRDGVVHVLLTMPHRGRPVYRFNFNDFDVDRRYYKPLDGRNQAVRVPEKKADETGGEKSQDGQPANAKQGNKYY